MQNQRGVRLFWPIILIGVGSILLLTNLGVITGNPWTIIFQLWPVLLIALGLEILLGGSTGWRAVMSALLGLALVGGVLWVLIAQPAIPGLNFGSSNLQTANVSHPLDGAESALKAMAQMKPSVIISDLVMPGTNGFELFQEIQKLREYKSIPFVFLTAVDDYYAKKFGKDLGGAAYVTKPVDLDELERILLDKMGA